MRKSTVRHLVAGCAFGLVPAVAYGQVGQQLTDQSAAKQNQPGATDTPPVTQTPQAGQVVPPQQGVTPRPGQTGQVQRQVVPGQAGTTIQANPSSDASRTAGSQNESQQLEKMVVKQLQISNDAEIELSQMAVDKAKSDEVKQFAQMLVDDHRQLNQQLASLGSKNGASSQGDQSQRNQGASTLPAPNRPGQTTQQNSATAQNDRAESGANRPNSRGQAGQEGLVSKLTSIAEKASKKHTEMVKEDLQGREGNEFDMAFVGYQIACHTTAVAKLEAMNGVGSPELQSVIAKAEQSVSNHLDKAKQLAEKLKNENKGE